MRFNSAFISSFLLTPAVLAGRGENPYQYINVTQNTLWAGAQLSGDNQSFYGISATVVVPAISGATPDYAASAWVGLGGGNGCSSLLQAGIALVAGENTFQAWFEWFPDPLTYVPNVTISTGDSIRIGVGLSSDLTFGTYLIDNFDKKQMNFERFGIAHTPCTSYAEWIVEDYTVNGTFANFGPIAFTNAVVFGPDREMYGPQNATMLYEMTRNGRTLASVSSLGLDAVTITRGSG